MKNKKIAIALLLAAAAGATYYWYAGSAATAPQAKNGKDGQPPTAVNVVTPVKRDVPMVLSATGTVVPVQSVELHPQTTSTIRKVHIKEGQFVKAGELMFSLDDRSEAANVDKAQAQIARERAALADLERQYKRNQELYEQKFIAKSALETLRSQVEAARAGLGAGAATLAAERVAASYGSIRAPMAGRVGAIDVHPGSLVQPATLLTTVTQLDPVNVAFTMPESALSDLLAAQRQGPVTVEASVGERAKPVQGKLSFIDNTVNPQAGTIRVKAVFDNRDALLWPGQYATARVTLRTLKDAVVIPQAAIITNTKGTSVYVVTDGAAASKPISRVHVFGTDAVVTGLAGDEQVITEGKQNLRPGGKVRLAPTPAASTAAGKNANTVAAKGQP